MEESEPQDGRARPRWLRIAAGGVALGLAGVLAGRLLAPAPEPALVAGLAGSWEAKDRGFAARVAARFPPGSPEAALIAELRGEGFAVSSARTAKWSRARPPCRTFAEIDWDAGAGRIVATRASMFEACG